MAQIAYIPFLNASDSPNGFDPAVTDNTVLAIDLKTGNTVKTITLGNKVGPVFLNQSGYLLYATSLEEPTIYVIDTQTLSITQKWLNLPAAPEKILLNEVNQKLYFYQRNTDIIYQLSLTSGQIEVAGTLPGLQQFWFSDNLRYLVTRQITTAGDLISTFDLQMASSLNPSDAIKSFISSEDIRYDTTVLTTISYVPTDVAPPIIYEDINSYIDNAITVHNDGERFFANDLAIETLGSFSLTDGTLIWDQVYTLEPSELFFGDSADIYQMQLYNFGEVEWLIYSAKQTQLSFILNMENGDFIRYSGNNSDSNTFLNTYQLTRIIGNDSYRVTLSHSKYRHCGLGAPCPGGYYDHSQLDIASTFNFYYIEHNDLLPGGLATERFEIGPNLFVGGAPQPVPANHPITLLLLLIVLLTVTAPCLIPSKKYKYN